MKSPLGWVRRGPWHRAGAKALPPGEKGPAYHAEDTSPYKWMMVCTVQILCNFLPL